jgi:hypothetical protein
MKRSLSLKGIEFIESISQPFETFFPLFHSSEFSKMTKRELPQA